MATFANERSAAREAPLAVVGRVRAAVRLVAHHPKDLCAAICNNVALFLDCGRVCPVLRVADGLAAGLRSVDDAAATLDGMAEHGLFRSRVSTEAHGAVAEVAGEGLFHDDVLAALQRFDG